MISQSDKIFGSILIAFIVYITVRGQLPSYMSLFTGKASGQSSNTTGQASGSSNSLFNDLSLNTGFSPGSFKTAASTVNSFINSAGQTISTVSNFANAASGNSSSSNSNSFDTTDIINSAGEFFSM